MAVKVQEMVTRLHRRLDPLTDDNVEITVSTVGTVDGQSFTKNRILDVYNEARMSVAATMRLVVPFWFSTRHMSGLLVRKTDLSFASGVATKPDGFIYAQRLSDVAGARIIVTSLDRVGALKDFESPTKRYVLDLGNQFVAESGSTYIPNAATYILWYWGVKDWVLADVTGGTALETFDDIWHNHLIEVANLIANEAGQEDVTALNIKYFKTIQTQISEATQ